MTRDRELEKESEGSHPDPEPGAGKGPAEKGASAAAADQRAWRGMGVVLDIPVKLSVEIGRAEMLVREVLQLSEGSVVELDRAAGDPVDLFVNGRRVGRGDLVVVDDRVGIRISEMEVDRAVAQES